MPETPDSIEAGARAVEEAAHYRDPFAVIYLLGLLADKLDTLNTNLAALAPVAGAGNPPPGSGSPEGVVVGSPGQTYMDKDAAGGAGALYWKKTGTGNTGWVLFG